MPMRSEGADKSASTEVEGGREEFLTVLWTPPHDRAASDVQGLTMLLREKTVVFNLADTSTITFDGVELRALLALPTEEARAA